MGEQTGQDFPIKVVAIGQHQLGHSKHHLSHSTYKHHLGHSLSCQHPSSTKCHHLSRKLPTSHHSPQPALTQPAQPAITQAAITQPALTDLFPPFPLTTDHHFRSPRDKRYKMLYLPLPLYTGQVEGLFQMSSNKTISCRYLARCQHWQ